MKIGQYLTKLCVDYAGLLFFGPPCILTCIVYAVGRPTVDNRRQWQTILDRVPMAMNSVVLVGVVIRFLKY